MEKYWFIFLDSNNLLLKKQEDGSLCVPLMEKEPIDVFRKIHSLGIVNGFESYTFRACTKEVPYGFESVGLRKSFNYLTSEFYTVAGRAFQIIFWDESYVYCPKCGAKLELNTPLSKICRDCGNEIWPRINPAIIVLVSRQGGDALLIHAKNFKGSFYGAVAGFLEIGESLEECVRREVREETGIEIDNIRYFASQPWPYPSGLMVGFFADYVSGDIKIQESELSDAQWFNVANLPEIPPKLSMARMLIDAWKLKVLI